MDYYVKDYEKVSIRHGPTVKEVRRAWMWDYPDTVVADIAFNGTTPYGGREYMVFWRKRKRESKRSKLVVSLKERGAKDMRGK